MKKNVVKVVQEYKKEKNGVIILQLFEILWTKLKNGTNFKNYIGLVYKLNTLFGMVETKEGKYRKEKWPIFTFWFQGWKEKESRGEL